MREVEKKKNQSTNRAKRPVKTPSRSDNNKPNEASGRRKPSNTKDSQSRANPKPVSSSVASETSVVVEPSEVYEDVVIHYVDDAYRSGGAALSSNGDDEDLETHQVKGEDSDFESVKDSTSSQGDDEKGSSELSSKSDVKPSQSEAKKGVRPNNPRATDEEMFDAASSGERSAESDEEERERGALREKLEAMESKAEKLEEELRAVAALEISLYSVVPEHGSSSHKVHTPALRLSRLYFHACKHWGRSKREMIARNTVSGLVLVARTCGNDVARLTFWLSNTIVLREIVSQAFGISPQLSPAIRLTENGNGERKLRGNSSGKQVNRAPQLSEDWQETSTFAAALERVESWIFSRVVESVWWQALTPNLLSPVEDLIGQKKNGRLSGPSLGDQQQGSFSIELWKNAFRSAFERLCPVRAGGHECGCLPIVARMVMEQCVERLDVAMFNAILRESAHQIPTDPVSDPIVDSRVLPIPAGDWSFGSGAQLKNSVGNWSRWFTVSLGMETENRSKGRDGETDDDDDSHTTANARTKCFHLLNELGDLLMLPKDMLMDRSIRGEVCPSIALAVIIRILCNFTPDEFCPDAVPGEVLEALNAENFVERRLAGDPAGSFPYAAAAVAYAPPSSEDVSEKVSEAGGKPRLERNASMVQKKGYTSDEELDDLDSPLLSFIEPSSPSTSKGASFGAKSMGREAGFGGNARYELLREVWSS